MTDKSFMDNSSDFNLFEKSLIEKYGIDNYKVMSTLKVGIAGCGGLGSNCGFNLVRSGIKNLTICDFDRIEPSNLNRQFFFYDQIGMYKSDALKENLTRINPDAFIKSNTVELSRENITEIYNDCDIVIEAFDKAEMKKILAEEILNTGKIYITASGISGWSDSDKITTKRISDKFILIGDLETEASDTVPPISPRVNIAAAKQANIVLEKFLTEVL